MNKYLCNNCGYIFCEKDMNQNNYEEYGEYAEYVCSCGSKEICGIDEDEICPVCGGWHETYDEWEDCYDLLYTEARGLFYITSEWTQEKTIEISLDLSDSGKGDTMKSLIWDGDCGVDFIKVICEVDDARGDIWRNYNIIKRISENVAIDNELIRKI